MLLCPLWSNQKLTMGSKAQIIEYLYKKDGLFSVDIVTIYDFFFY